MAIMFRGTGSGMDLVGHTVVTWEADSVAMPLGKLSPFFFGSAKGLLRMGTPQNDAAVAVADAADVLKLHRLRR